MVIRTYYMSETIIRQWGNSMAIIIPAEEAKARNLKIGDEVVVTVAKISNLRKAFGSLKRKPGLTGQLFKDEAKVGWEKH